MPTKNKKNPYSSIVERNAFGLETESYLEPMVIGLPDEESNEGLEITGVHTLDRKRTLSMTGVSGEGERKNYSFRKFTNKATKYKPQWLEIDSSGKPLKNSSINIDSLQMKEGKRGQLKSVKYFNRSDKNPSIKRADWRGKQEGEFEVITLPLDDWNPQPAIDIDEQTPPEDVPAWTKDASGNWQLQGSTGGEVPDFKERKAPAFNDWIKQNYPSMQNKIHEPENVLWKEEMEELWSQQP